MAETIDIVLRVMADVWENGCPVARPDKIIASRAVRRWESSGNRGVVQHDHAARVRDLAKGLISYREKDASQIGPLAEDYAHLADAIANSLARLD